MQDGNEDESMTPKDQIEGLKQLLYREAAISLLNFQRAEGEQSRSWDDLMPEEQQGRMDFAADWLRKTENPELFSDNMLSEIDALRDIAISAHVRWMRCRPDPAGGNRPKLPLGEADLRKLAAKELGISDIGEHFRDNLKMVLTPDAKIAALKARLAKAEAESLHLRRMLHAGETRSWDDLPAEEQDARIWYAEYLLSKEMPEVFGNA
jgi:hypothetical protein